jgi:hypothetical protein
MCISAGHPGVERLVVRVGGFDAVIDEKRVDGLAGS